ncbi:hypothetical protein EDC04DRAFT_991756 [Pisolithus marmoratus]|nr:hypothetical protein EDC04DRAFT_991756 [Pisolithus marmoratus]
MYAWYENSDRCYALLHDLDDQVLPTQRDQNFSEFNSWPKWFSRGWTLQELIAPAHVQFFNRHWEVVGNKKVNSDALSVITGISTDVLVKGLGSSNPSVAQIMSWAANRSTTREEDRAYSLLGLFGVHMPMLYGEGKGAFLRLQLEIIRMTNDQSIFAWCWTGRKDTGRSGSFLADDPSYFHDCSNIHRMHHDDLLDALHKPLPPVKGDSPGIAGSQEERLQTFMVTNYGIQIWLHLQPDFSSRGQELYSVMLACRKTGEDSPIVITMRRSGSNYSRYFYRRSADWDDKAPTEFKQLFLPYRDKVVNNLNVRGPQAKQVGLDAGDLVHRYSTQRYRHCGLGCITFSKDKYHQKSY